jgi:hypothetical protein
MGPLTDRTTAARGAAAVLAAVVALGGLSACGEDTGSGAGKQSAPTKGSSAAPAGEKKTTTRNMDGGGY